MLILFTTLMILSGGPAGQEEIIRRRPPSEVPSAPTGGQLVAPTSGVVVTANTALNCVFGGQAVPCAHEVAAAEEATETASEDESVEDDLWSLFNLQPIDGPISTGSGYSRSQATASPPVPAPQPRPGCRREEQRSADGTSVSVQTICGNDSASQRAVSEFLNRPR